MIFWLELKSSQPLRRSDKGQWTAPAAERLSPTVRFAGLKIEPLRNFDYLISDFALRGFDRDRLPFSLVHQAGAERREIGNPAGGQIHSLRPDNAITVFLPTAPFLNRRA